MRIRLAFLAGAFLLALSQATPALAETIPERINHMEKRLDQGVSSKELTRHEAEKLRK